jgi:hypothetical protein
LKKESCVNAAQETKQKKMRTFKIEGSHFFMIMQ